MSRLTTELKDPVWLRQYITNHPSSHALGVIDWIPFGGLTLASCALIGLTPPTTGWKFVRATMFGLYLSYQVYFCLFTVEHTWEAHFGYCIAMCWHFIKGLEVMLLYPPEENLFRIRRVEGGWEDESVPQHGTMKKLYWALDVWFSQRGLGWNYAAPLPASSKRPPFTRGSRRTAFVFSRLKYLATLYLLNDLARSYMTFGPDAAFFSGRPGISPPYHTLGIAQRILTSLPIVVRAVWSAEEWYTPVSIVFVIFGGLSGWEGNWFGCEGWPPLFGTIKDLWVHPGLSHLWSKSGIASRPRAPSTIRISAQTPSRQPSPLVPTARSSPKYLLINFTKSLIVFTLCGLYHDLPCYILLLRTSEPGSPITLADSFPTSTFFILQPVALCIEALVKRFWRIWKAGSYTKKEEPGCLITFERTVGFIWTWWWIGYTSRYFVMGLTRSGVYLRKENQPVKFSPLGGAIYGQWYH